ncbi:histidinol dehydrogenase [Aureibacter tunicatorum]|uniref:Histidinol dehydrogenase n=1 Tax=Aureibacter tunicatorum TaxID=866807 RepID=A0AAE3XLQ1_9BACT|nr:histidinol dehydrogenase [Aureibacter tunicatorum]MDR6238747.1 histidinol dehydrogenase [Aureibacter tunicatorum]BDD05322.1 histidinol dehydrogenase [Aureibacter tunicatorum]
MEKFIEPNINDWPELISRPVKNFDDIKKIVQPVLDKIKHEGDSALKEFTQKFDGAEINDFLVSTEELDKASSLVSQELKEALQLAKNNIEKFHAAQADEVLTVETMPGVSCVRKSVAIRKVGLYIPGGTAPLFSTVLMLAIPAKIAGCKEIVLCTPPNKEGNIHPAILYAAKLTGINTVIKAGGAQAVAAMAFGTESVPKVDKIFGPGNQYVTAAKQIVSQSEKVAIDMPAGPSEVAVYADAASIPSFVASDLLSQAEHGVDSQVILVADTEKTVDEINDAVAEQLELLSRKDIAIEALKNSRAFVINNKQTAIDFLNEYAAEHLILANEDADDVAEQIINAGSVFIGNFTPESAGDYASGTNHTLPTNGYANAYSGVSLDSFVKKITFQKITKEGIKAIGPSIELMAEEEQLDAHKNAVTLRLKYLQENV